MEIPSKALVSLSQITPETLERIFEIYDEQVGGHAIEGLELYDLQYYLQQVSALAGRTRDIEWRFGSELSRKSKLALRVDGLYDEGEDRQVEIYFSPNVDVSTPQSDTMRQRFSQAVLGLFQQKG